MGPARAGSIHGTPWRGPCLPVLVRAALAHVQFETKSHPFLDAMADWAGLLIVFGADRCRGSAAATSLFSSLFFKQHRKPATTHR